MTTPMSAFKLYKATSFCRYNNNNYYSTRATTTTTNTHRSKISVKPIASLSPCNNGRWWRISSCEPLFSLAHVTSLSSNKRLGFDRSSFGGGGFKSWSCLSGKESGSGSESGSGVVADMGAESDINGSALTQNDDRQEKQKQSSKLLTLPTILTLGRVAAVPLFISTFYVDSWCGTTATTAIFIAASITDWLDGYLARKMKLSSTFGAFLDPVADKLMVAAALVLLCSKPVDACGHAPWLLTVPSVAIIGREITMSAVREWAASQNTKLLEAVAVNNLGKWKTASQMTALTILLATRDSSLAGPGILVASGVGLLYISAGLAVMSLVVYMKKIWRVLLK